MKDNRLPDYLDHMQQAATDALAFVEGVSKEDFVQDKRTQQAVIMSLIIIVRQQPRQWTVIQTSYWHTPKYLGGVCAICVIAWPTDISISIWMWFGLQLKNGSQRY